MRKIFELPDPEPCPNIDYACTFVNKPGNMSGIKHLSSSVRVTQNHHLTDSR